MEKSSTMEHSESPDPTFHPNPACKHLYEISSAQ